MGVGAIRTLAACSSVLMLLGGCSSETPMPPVEVTVPSLYALPLSTAVSALQSLGLRGADDLEAPCPSGSGSLAGPREPIVLAQHPAPGSKVPNGSLVHLHTC